MGCLLHAVEKDPARAEETDAGARLFGTVTIKRQKPCHLFLVFGLFHLFPTSPVSKIKKNTFIY